MSEKIRGVEGLAINFYKSPNSRCYTPDISATVVVSMVNMLSVDSAALVVAGADFLGELGPSVVVFGTGVVVVVTVTTGSSSSKGKTLPATSTIPE